MIGSRLEALPPRGRPEMTAGLQPARGETLTIALVNNMPDAALLATERQFCRLLGAASDGLLVRLKFFAIPGIERSAASMDHIARYYEDFADLHRDPPDGIIVTGTEPKAPSLREESIWPSLSWLVDWAEDCGIPGIWSCLAAHAAVLHMDGIERHRLKTRLSGLFECHMTPHRHQVLQGTPRAWRVPHSRVYGLHERALHTSGYSILSRCRNVGPDIFVRQGRALQIYFQGHPEYRATTLLAEYRRDAARFLHGTRDSYPAAPRDYFSAAAAAEFGRIAAIARKSRDPGALAAFDALAAKQSLVNSWRGQARRIYANWLCHLQDAQAKRPTQIGFARRPASAEIAA